MLLKYIVSFVVGVSLLTACASQDGSDVVVRESPSNCAPFENTQPICGFHNPEDMAVLPGQRTLLVSEYGDSHGRKAGALSLLKLDSVERVELFRGGDAVLPAEQWGAENCTEPPGPAFSPHGIDLVRRMDGRLQLAVIQHGGRESIELFEVEGDATDWRVSWRGCVMAPSNAQLNSVAATSTGDLYVTKMVSMNESLEALSGIPEQGTGEVYHWSAANGYRIVPGTAGVMPNGIALDEAAGTLFVNYSGSGLVKKVALHNGEVLAEVQVSSPDNIKWSADRRSLLVASLRAPLGDIDSFRICMEGEPEYCPIPFAIVELDPQTFDASTLFENSDAPMGGGTVGMKLNNRLYIGSFAGNRILRVDL